MRLAPFFLILLSLLALPGCSPRVLIKPFDADKIQLQYSHSIGDAAKPQPWEISHNLVAVTPENATLVWKEIQGETYLLVSTWQKDTIYYKNDPNTGFYNTGNYPIWVTTAPELQQRCQDEQFGKKEGLDLRLKQLLGLPPNTEKYFFVEFWVRPQDLFRPCPDSEITDSECGLAFPADIPQTHIDWINQLRLDSYFNPQWDANYPWTALGYTYDWNHKNKDHVGLSEFLIGKNKNVIVNRFQATEVYCRPQ